MWLIRTSLLAAVALATVLSAQSVPPDFPLPGLQTSGLASYGGSGAALDFDGDGFPDVALAGWFGFELFQGTPAGDLLPFQSISGSDGAAGRVAAGDMDADGYQDVVYIPQGAGFHDLALRRGSPAGLGAPLYSSSSFDSFTGLSVGALDSNPGVDAVIVRDDVARLYRYVPGGMALFSSVTFSGAQLGFSATADMDLDGDVDLIVANGNFGLPDDVRIARNGGNGLSWTFGSSISITPLIIGLAVGDVNQDGWQDVVVACSDDRVRIALNDGAGGLLEVSTTIQVGYAPQALLVGPTGADPIPDIVVAGGESGTLAVLRNLGGGSFASPVKLPLGNEPAQVVLADLAADGAREVLAFCGGGDVFRVPFDAAGQPVVPAAVAAGSGARGVAVGDFDEDGALDAVTADYSAGTLTLLRGDGAGGLATQAVRPMGSGSLPRGLAVSDLDRDGHLDLLATLYGADQVAVLRGDGDFGFTALPSVPTGEEPYAVAVAHLNADGLPDLAVTCYVSDTVSLHFGDGTGAFPASQVLACGDGPMGVATGDVNQDGWTDVLVAARQAGEVSVYLSDGLGSVQFAYAATLFGTSAGYLSDVAVGQLDGDALPEVCTPMDGNLMVVEMGTALVEGPHLSGWMPFAVIAADLTGDGRDDFALANRDGNTVSVFSMPGGSPMPARVPFAVAEEPRALAAGDLDGDGRPELLVAGAAQGQLAILHNATQPWRWSDLGSGLAGLHGAPRLTGRGSLVAGSASDLRLERARAGAAALLFTALSATPTPFKGGTLQPFPWLIEPLPLAVGPHGLLQLPFPWPAGLPSGLSLVWQVAVSDPDAVRGVALSNAVRATVP